MSNIFGLGGASTQQQPSSVFGGGTNQPKSSVFGAPNTGTLLFSQPASNSSTPFSFNTTSSSAPAVKSVFGAPLGTSQPQLGGVLFGTVPLQPQQQTGGVFGGPGSSGGGLFGTVPNTQQQGTSVFGQPQNQAAKPFGFPAASTTNNQQGGGAFGQPNNTNQQQGGGLFGLGGSTSQQQQQGNSLFGRPQNQQPQQQQQQQQQLQQQQTGSVFGQSLQSRIWSEQEGQPRKYPALLISSL